MVTLRLVAAVVGTDYATLIAPQVKDVIAGPGKLQVTVLQHGEFTIRGPPHDGAWVFPTGSSGPEDLLSSMIHGRSDEFNTWAFEHGGVEARTLGLRLSVRARDESPAYRGPMHMAGDIVVEVGVPCPLTGL